MTVNCDFRKNSEIYSCNVTALNNLRDDNRIVSSVIGYHLVNYDDNEVNSLIIEHQELLFIPEGINEKFPYIKYIEIHYTTLTTLNKRSFIEHDLEIVDLSHNKIKTIMPETFNCPNLEELNLSHNEMEELSPKIFKHSMKISVLNLSNNNIKSLSQGFLKKIPELKKLLMQNNQLKELKEKTFEFCPQLEEIDFSGNNLIFITPSLTHEIKNLKKFNFTGNACFDKDKVDDYSILDLNILSGKIKLMSC